MKFVAQLAHIDNDATEEDFNEFDIDVIEDGLIDVAAIAASAPPESAGVEKTICHIWSAGVTIELVVRIRAGIHDASPILALGGGSK